MADFSGFLNKVGSEAIDGKLGAPSNRVATPVNSFITKVNNVFGTNIRTVNPTAVLKSIMSSEVSERFGGGINTNSPVRTAGESYAKRDFYSELDKRFDPVTNFEWMAVIRDRSGRSEDMPWYYIDDITLPTPQFGSTPKYIRGKEHKYADMFSVNTCTIKLFSDVSGLAFNYANAWCRSIYRDDNLYQMPKMYKRDIWIFILDATKKVVVDIQLIGCWPSSWGEYSLVSGAAGHLETSLTLSVDDFKMNYSDNTDAIRAHIEKVSNDSLEMSRLLSGNKQGAQNLKQGLLQNMGAKVNEAAGLVQNRINSVLGF